MARRRSGKKIDFTHWTRGGFAAGGHSAGTIATTTFAAQHLPETLLRTRGNLVAYIDGPSAPGKLVTVGVGMILVPEGTGSTVLWSPITDDDAPWLWYESFELGYEEDVTDVISIPGLDLFRATIDSKAMRVIKNQEIQTVVENVTVLTASSINVATEVRCLFGT